MQAAEQDWSACMKTHGHSFPADVFSASNSLNTPDVRPRPAPDSKEIGLAVADSQCVNTSGIIKAWSTAETAWQKKE
ncbi:hypothetical protein ACFQ6V_31215, partial [Streptomyces roseifaciens]